MLRNQDLKSENEILGLDALGNMLSFKFKGTEPQEKFMEVGDDHFFHFLNIGDVYFISGKFTKRSNRMIFNLPNVETYSVDNPAQMIQVIINDNLTTTYKNGIAFFSCYENKIVIENLDDFENNSEIFINATFFNKSLP